MSGSLGFIRLSPLTNFVLLSSVNFTLVSPWEHARFSVLLARSMPSSQKTPECALHDYSTSHPACLLTTLWLNSANIHTAANMTDEQRLVQDL